MCPGYWYGGQPLQTGMGSARWTPSFVTGHIGRCSMGHGQLRGDQCRPQMHETKIGDSSVNMGEKVALSSPR